MVSFFNNHFSYRRDFENLTNRLYKVTQGNNDSLIDYLKKFRKEAQDIPHLDVATTVRAFKIGIKKDSLFHEDLVMTPCKKLDEVRNIALRFIRLEEYKKIQKRKNTSYDHPNKKNDSSS